MDALEKCEFSYTNAHSLSFVMLVILIYWLIDWEFVFISKGNYIFSEGKCLQRDVLDGDAVSWKDFQEQSVLLQI